MLFRLSVVFFIVYSTLFGGVVETHPFVKILHYLGSALIIALWLASLVWRNRAFPVTRLNSPMWFLGLGWFISALLGQGPRVSFEYVWATFFHIMFFFICIDLIRCKREKWLIEGVFFTVGVVIILGTIEMIFWYFIGGLLPEFAFSWTEIAGYTLPPSIHELRLPLNYNNPTGAYAIITLPLVVAWGNTASQPDFRRVLYVMALCLFGILLLTQSRGAYLALAALIGFSAIVWLLRADVRARFPAPVRALIRPRNVLLGAGLAAMVAGLILYQVILLPDNPNPNDGSRIDLWLSSIEMFEDHFWFGVGPYQYKEMRLSYGHWERSYSLLALNHAHNLFFNLIAEGGVVLLTITIWLIVRLSRIFWSAWRHASHRNRRRLEACLVALLAFGVHNMVDAFLQTQLMIPALIILAFIVSKDTYVPPHMVKREGVSAQQGHWIARLNFALAAGVVLLAPIIAVPILRGAFYQNLLLPQYAEKNYVEALDTVHAAQNADPDLDLYVIEEAVILGFLSDTEPDSYLAQTVAVFEESLERTPLWAIGWHNLAALYKEQGDYERAIEAETQANQFLPLQLEFRFKLGEYYELAGRRAEAREIYFELLHDYPWLASSAFWTMPAYPDRSAFLDDALARYAGTPTEIDLLFYRGDLDQLAEKKREMTDDTSPEIQRRLSSLWPDASPDPCLYCYHVIENDNEVIRDVERILHTTSPDQAARDEIKKRIQREIFMNNPGAQWGWFILARLAEEEGQSEDLVIRYLARASALPRQYRRMFWGVYWMQGIVDIIPQARAPLMSEFTYEPLLRWLHLESEAGNVDEVDAICTYILTIDPYVRASECAE